MVAHLMHFRCEMSMVDLIVEFGCVQKDRSSSHSWPKARSRKSSFVILFIGRLLLRGAGTLLLLVVEAVFEECLPVLVGSSFKI